MLSKLFVCSLSPFTEPVMLLLRFTQAVPEVACQRVAAIGITMKRVTQH